MNSESLREAKQEKGAIDQGSSSNNTLKSGYQKTKNHARQNDQAGRQAGPGEEHTIIHINFIRIRM